jgi:L-alanine-DL-glutamate epimerase-like enolase superfamily enzyme
MWQPYDLRWIEDPFARSRARDTAELRRRGGVPIAAGDEATRPGEPEELLDAGAVDVLRLDATAIGGVDATRALALAARRHGASASAHVHPELHVHCALADPAFAHVEAFPTDRPFDCSHELLVRPFMAGVRDGHAPVPDEAGTGMRLDLDAVRRTSYRHAITYQEER